MTNKITRRSALKGLAGVAGALAMPKVADAFESQPTLEESLGRLPRTTEYCRDEQEAVELAEITIHPKDMSFEGRDRIKIYETEKVVGYVAGIYENEKGNSIVMGPETELKGEKLFLREYFTKYPQYGGNITIDQIIDYKTIRKL